MMNLSKHYIVEVHSVKKIKKKWEVLFFDLTTNCHDKQTRRHEFFTEDEWKKTKSRGYYMA